MGIAFDYNMWASYQEYLQICGSANPLICSYFSISEEIRVSAFFTDKKENQIFLIYKEIQNGAVSKSYMRKGFLIYEEMQKIFPHK